MSALPNYIIVFNKKVPGLSWIQMCISLAPSYDLKPSHFRAQSSWLPGALCFMSLATADSIVFSKAGPVWTHAVKKKRFNKAHNYPGPLSMM